MKKIFITLIAYYAVFLSTSVNASGTWSTFYPISEVNFQPYSGALFVSLNPASAHPNPAGCARTNWIRVSNNEWMEYVHKMLLTAQASGLRVTIYVDGTACDGSYPKLKYVKTRI